MVLSPDSVILFLSYLLYCVQFFGVAIGVGAETVMLVSYIAATRDGIIENSEERMALAVRRVLNWGLVLMIVSGLVITALHFAAGEEFTTALTPAYLFKWALIIVVLVFNTTLRHTMPLTAFEGLAAGSWFAIFLDHILALDFSWTLLLEWYAVWMVGFNLVWWGLVLILKGKSPMPTSPLTSARLVSTSASNVTRPAYKPVPPVIAISKPATVLSTPPPPPAPAPIFTPTKTTAPHKSFWSFFTFSRAKPQSVLMPVRTPMPTVVPAPTPVPVRAPAPPGAAQTLASMPLSAPVGLEQSPSTPLIPAVSPPRVVIKQFVPPPPPPSNLPTLNSTPVMQKPELINDPDQNPWLPAIKVMPKTPEDVANQNRASVVRLD